MTSPIPAPANAIPDRAAINRANSRYSTGPRTPDGKLRASQNALTHGLTSRIPVLPTEDPDAYQKHCDQFREEYKPATPTEQHLTQELADTAWRLNRIRILEAKLLDSATSPRSNFQLDMIDTHRTLATLGLHGQRLSRQFHKALELLRAIQKDRRQQHDAELARAAALLQVHTNAAIPYDPAQDGFVFSIDEIQAAARRLGRQKQADQIVREQFRTAGGRS